MDKEKVNKSKIIKTITIYMLLFLIMVLGIVLYSKFLPKNSFSADNEMIKLQANLEKYINYKTSENDKGTLVQFNVKTSIECKSQDTKYIPPKQTQIKLEMSQIDGKYPHSIKLIPISTEATNGKTKDIKEDYRYDPETGNLIINTSNLDENNELMCAEKKANAKDEYTVICYYDTYIEQAVEREIAIKATAIGVLSEDDSLINFQEEFKGKVKDNVGELVSVENVTPEIYNGNIKSNIINKTEYTTKYNETQKISVSKKDAQERIYIVENNEFSKIEKTQSGEQVETDLENNNELIYKTTTINKEDVIKILGEDGKIEILNNDQEVLASIDKNTEFDENGNVTINYLNDIKSIIIKTSKIQNEGILKLENTKEIKSTMTNAVDTRIKTTVKLFDLKDEIKEKNEETNNKIIEKNKDTAEQTVVQENKNENTINNIKDATTSNEVTTNETDSKNKEKIEEIKQILVLKSEKNNTIELKNSTTNIDFRINNTNWTNKEQNEVVFDINLNSNDLKDNLFNNPKLGIELPKEVEKVILGDSHLVYGNGLELKDVQLQKNNEDKFVIIANIEGNQITYNENSLELKTSIHIPTTIILKKDIESITDNINYVCENNYTLDGNKEIINNNQIIKIQNYKEEKVENTENKNNDVRENNATINRNIEVIKNETPNMIEGLDLEVVPVKGDTVLNNGDIVYEGEFIKYNIKVTNNSNKAVDNLKIVGSVPEGTTYGELEADYHTSRIEIEERYNRQIGDELYKYNYDTNIEEKNIEVGTLLPNESKEVFYEVRTKNLNNEERKEIIAEIKVYRGDVKVAEREIKNNINSAEVKVFVASYMDASKNDWIYDVTIDGNKEVTLNLKVPKEFKFERIVNSTNETSISDDNIITVRLAPGKYIFKGNIDGKKIQNQTEESKIELIAVATIVENNKIYKSNENRIMYEYENVSIKMTSENEGEEVPYKGEINYQIKIENKGSTNLRDEHNITAIKVKDYLPKEIIPEKITYENFEREIIDHNEETDEYILGDDYRKVTKNINLGSKITDSNIPDLDLSLNIPEKESIIITINATADTVFEKTKIENSATVTGENIITKISNRISHTILPFDNVINDPNNPNTPDNPDNPNNSDNSNDPKGNDGYSLSGVAWIDINQDGQRQTDEETLSGINVMLVNMNNSNAIQSKKMTDSEGKYTFTNLERGKYIVVFNYDLDKYSLTEYKKEGVALSLNSDAMSEEITISGNKTKVGLTDIITLDASISNIDIGLIKNKICDLKLDKYVSKVIVKTKNGTTEQSYDNSQLAKVEIKAKEIQGATVLVEYKLVITNEGEITSSANKIIDYIPAGLDFSSELNKDWIFVKDGEVVNESVSNIKIEPGKSIDLTLMLTKTMSNDSTGTYTNIAEIGEISNSLKIDDKDSKPENKNQTEDDYSKADLIISVSTGILVYISFICGIVLVLGIVVFISIKYGIKKTNKLLIFTLLIITSVFHKFNESNASYGLPNVYDGPIYFTCNKDYPTFFYGTINGKSVVGSCNMSGGWFGGDRYYYLYATSNLVTTTLSENTAASISLNKKNSSDNEVKINEIGNNYVIGPLKISGDSDSSYSFEVYITGESNAIGVSACDSSGNTDINLNFSTSTTTTVYVKLAKSQINMSSGQRISQVKCKANRTVTSSKKTLKTLNAYYRPDSLSYWPTWTDEEGNTRYFQDIKVPLKFEDNESTTIPQEKSISWEIKYGDLQIIKVDKNNPDVKLKGVKFNVTGPSYPGGKILTTGNDGKTEKLTNILLGKYNVEEISNDNYGYNVLTSEEITVNAGMNNEEIVENQKQTGNLIIHKKDIDSDEILEGVSFTLKAGEGNPNEGKYLKITNAKSGEGFNSSENTCTGTVHILGMTFIENESQATKFITDNNGFIKIYNIIKGYYDIEETSVGNNYLYEIDENFISWEYKSLHQESEISSKKDKSKIASIWIHMRSSTNTEENININTPNDDSPTDYLVFKNRRKYIDLSGYVWVDDFYGKQTERNDLYNNDDELLNGIPVRLKRGDGEVTILDATALSKHLNGTHVIPEIEPHGLGDVNNDGIVNEADRQMIQQYLAEMIQLTEEEKIRADIDQSDKETGFATTTKTLNRYSTDEKKTGDGEYYFRRVPIYGSDGITNILDEYYIEFEYNGIIYQNVNPNIGENKGSKAIERTADRNQFHSDFSTIEGKGESEPDKGIAKDGNIDLTYELEKNNDGIGRKAIQNNYYRMKANTANASYNIKTNATIEGNKFKKEVRYINLGLYKREQPDLETTSDVINMQAKIRGYEYTYDKMGQRASNSQYIEDETNHNNAEDSKGIADELKHQFDLSTSFGLKYGPNDYTEYLYASDIQRSKDTTNDDKLEVYVKYKVQFKNKSTNLDSTVNEFINFFDSRYEKVESIEEESGNIIGESEYKVESYNDKYKKLTITKPQNIDRQSSKFVYITFKLSDNGINAILTDDAELQDISEISSYSTYKSGSHYGGIDKDSNPGNSKPADKESKDFEDDTDFAPGLKISIKQREITGTIWEDSVAKNNAIEGVLGDGIYNAGENVFENVKVELLEEDGGTYKNAELYKYEGGATSNVVMTNKKGEYTFSGVLPGKYIVRYSYGNTDEVKSVIYDSSQNKVQLKDSYNNPIEFDPDNYKSTIFKNNTDPYWYAEGTSISETDNTRYSDARDKYATKKDGTKIEDIVEYRTKTGGDYEYDQIINYEEAIKLAEQKTISAETNKFDVRIENNKDDYETSANRRNDITITEDGKRIITIIYDQMDFGIIRRAKPKLKMSKTIIWIEVTLANGQTIIAGNPQEEEIKYLKRLPNGDVTIELDNELIQGAKLKVKYNINANTEGAETDYLDENYYLYGTIPADRDGTIKKIQIERIHDYPQSGFVFDASIAENNKYWDMYDETHIISDTGKLISNDVAKDITDGHFYILKTKEKYSLKPGEDKNITLELTKVLANSEDISLDNGVEVIVLKNKKIENSIPGNYKPASQGPKEYDSDNAYLSVTAPTGKTDHTQEIVIISISLLIILGTGIVFIKKKILNNKGGN